MKDMSWHHRGVWRALFFSCICCCRLSGLGWPDEDGSSEHFWSARSRVGSTASSIYLDAESELGSEASVELTPARSGALAQMQVRWRLWIYGHRACSVLLPLLAIRASCSPPSSCPAMACALCCCWNLTLDYICLQEKLVAAHEELEQLSAAKADAARLAALRGRAAEAQGAALCAAEASLARKRAALAQAQAAAEAAEAALERIRIERQADDVKVHLHRCMQTDAFHNTLLLCA